MILAICLGLFLGLLLICWASAEYIDMQRFPVIPPWEPIDDPMHVAKVDLHQARVDFYSDEAIQRRPLWKGSPKYDDFVCGLDSIERELRAAIAVQALHETY